MSDYEHEEEIERQEDAENAEALARAEEFILEVASDVQPSSLSELRQVMNERSLVRNIDPSLLRAALWALLNENRLELARDRTLHVAG